MIPIHLEREDLCEVCFATEKLYTFYMFEMFKC